MNNKLKVMTIVGTRPEIIRLSRIISLFDKYTNHILVHTGQNYDYELNEIFFRDLGIRLPDYNLNIDTSSLGTVLGQILIKIEDVLNLEKPDAVLILGDTNSSLASIMAKRKHIPVYHLEAGNRSFDANVPEEINRKIIDHIADFNLVYTEHARRNLIAEGIAAKKIYLIGSPMKEIIDFFMPAIKMSDVVKKLNLNNGEYFLASVHREENVDFEYNLKNILISMNYLAEIYALPIIVSLHPRTKLRIESLHELSIHPLIKFSKPFGFIDYNWLQINSKCVISDSGTISEESAILKFPAITIRNSMERPESMDAGTIILSGLDTNSIANSVEIAIGDAINKKSICDEYKITDTSARTLKLVTGTAKLHKQWNSLY